MQLGADLGEYLARAEQVIRPSDSLNGVPAVLELAAQAPLHVGVDLGTAYLVLVVLDEDKQPVAGEYQFAQVVRDGLVVDFVGAVDRLREMKTRMEERLGRELSQAASGYPPGVPQAEVRAVANVVEAAGFHCSGLVDEPTAANALLGIQDGAIVDVGGGTTGIAVLKDGEVVYTADEATGGTHFTLVVAGAHDISFEEAEVMKTNPAEQQRLYPVLRPVMEKVGTITARHLAGHHVEQITLVGGSTAFPGFAEVVAEVTGVPTQVPERPLLVTPIGLALQDKI